MSVMLPIVGSDAPSDEPKMSQTEVMVRSLPLLQNPVLPAKCRTKLTTSVNIVYHAFLYQDHFLAIMKTHMMWLNDTGLLQYGAQLHTQLGMRRVSPHPQGLNAPWPLSMAAATGWGAETKAAF